MILLDFNYDSLPPLVVLLLVLAGGTVFVVKQVKSKAKDDEEASTMRESVLAQIKRRRENRFKNSSTSTEVTATTKNEQDDVLDIMEDNLAELRTYYVISKQQARQSFNAALLACFLGFALFAIGILMSYDPDYDGSFAYSAIAGSVVEVISGLFFWLYSKAVDQMAKYYDGLTLTQSQLTSIELAEKMDTNNRNRAYAYIICKIMDSEQAATLDIVDNDTQSTGDTNGAGQ